jgi:hypothetical protein
MIRRVLICALVVILVHTSLPVSASAEQPAPAQAEQTDSTTSAPAHVYADLPQAQRTLDLQKATRAFILTGSTPLQHSTAVQPSTPVQHPRSLQQTLRQTTSGSGGSSNSRPWLLTAGILAGVGLGIWALESLSPKQTDARCSSTNPQFCN